MKQSLLGRQTAPHSHKPAKNIRKVQVLAQTSAFLKQQIAHIIKSQLKSFQQYSKMQSQLEQYRKEAALKLENQSLCEQKLQKHRKKQKNECEHKCQQFNKKQQLIQNKMKVFQLRKQGLHQHKFSNINRSLQKVHYRFEAQTQMDSQARLSRIQLTNTQPTLIVSPNKSSRAASLSQSRYHSDFIGHQSLTKQNQLVTKYLNKIQKSDSRVLEQQLVKQNRILQGRKNKAQCFIKKRQADSNKFMEQTQQELSKRMQKFSRNHSRLMEMKENILMKKTIVEDQMLESVLRKRQEIKHQEIQQTVKSFKEHDKKLEKLRNYRSFVDLRLTKTNKQNNLFKMHEEEKIDQLQSNLKLLTQKIRKLKDVSYGQKLDQQSISLILSMLDKQDPQFQKISTFLNCERKAYLQTLVKEEQKIKMQRMKKMLKTQKQP